MNRDKNLEISFSGFQNLMRYRVNDILLVSSLYDAFILAQDGQIDEMILTEFREMNLTHAPRITRTKSAELALQMMHNLHRFDMILLTTHLGDLTVEEFVKEARLFNRKIPIILLTYEIRELDLIKDFSGITKIFHWQGDFKILLAITKFIEDRLNVEHDSREMGVQTIIVIEDNLRFYSSYLPMIYSLLMEHSQNLISEGVNMAHKIMRMRARPKILMCETYEEAWENFERYQHFLLGVISDIQFPRGGKKDSLAGAHFARMVRSIEPDIPILLQSFQPEISDIAKELEVSFIRKNSPTLMMEVKQYMIDHFGFGDFVFRNDFGDEIDRAIGLHDLERKLHHIPLDSLLFHAERNHFSNWLKARTEFNLANKLKPRRITDFDAPEDVRQEIISALRQSRRERNRELVVDFEKDKFDPADGFARVGKGSLGGKGRGLAFINHLLHNFNLRDKFPQFNIFVPPAVVLSTDVFDEFMKFNNLLDFGISCDDEDEIERRFLEADFPPHYKPYIEGIIDIIDYPIAVRSSSLLEDSQYQPFAGIYETFMLPNNDADKNVRSEDLRRTIQLIYASIYKNLARNYVETTPYRLEEEKMAVIIQKIVGTKHHNRFYPEISGVARSYNFYAKAPLKAADGIVAIALGLGKMIVEGGQTVRFCPKLPQNQISFHTTSDYLEFSQRDFFALNLESRNCFQNCEEGTDLTRYSLMKAEEDGTLHRCGSVYSPENDAIYDGLSRKGVRLVTFAPLLKNRSYNVPELIDAMLELGKLGLGGPVELEFAVNMNHESKSEDEFALLQLRPMVLKREIESLEVSDIDPDRILCQSNKVLGVGEINDIKDVVIVDINSFNRAESVKVAAEVEQFNARLVREGKPYLLIGVGRWGSSDPWLGIPVSWEQISGARVIVEAGFKDFKVTPSEGAHFFHNIVSYMIGYFTVNPDHQDGNLDWDWFLNQPVYHSGNMVKHLRLHQPLRIIMNGFKNYGVICH